LVDLPLLLAGPIIRRAETSGIWIWLATSEAVYEVTAFLYPFDENGKAKAQYWSAPSASFRCVRLGKKLWVTLFKIAIKYGEFPKDVILGYNFEIRTSSGVTSLEKLVGDNFRQDLCYHPFPLPTLFLQSSNGNLAQGSCRRPGGPGQDAFNSFDSRLKKVCTNLKSRPAAFFLTGDQIYADWVSYPFFASLRLLSVDIMGYHELVPISLPFGQGGPKLVPATAIGYSFSKTDKDTRRDVVLKAGLTTDDGEGHLMSFGEFAAHYLLIWNPVLCAKYHVENERGRYDPEWENLKGFITRVAEARRVLANIPTYMSFDDHDITDDWNLDDIWIKRTNYGLARRVLTNALAAFWLFQGWGNVPELQGQGIGAQTTDQIEERLNALLKEPRKYAIDADFEDNMLNRKEPYAFVAPTKPTVIVTDMRTQRESGLLSVNAHTSLLNDTAYKHLTEICKLPPNKPIVIISGTPLLNWFPMIFMRNLGFMAKKKEEARKQYELGDIWDDHSEGRARFIEWIHDTLKPSYCVIFSGDVHHGSFIQGKVSMRAPRSIKELWSLDIINITSSPMKNESPDLTGDFAGVHLADLLDYQLPTSKSEGFSFSEDGRHMRMSYEAVKFRGSLAHRLQAGPIVFNNAVVFRNHFCVVDFSHPKKISATFFGFGGKNCSAQVNIPLEIEVSEIDFAQ
jgi:hypothetical protein